MNLLVLLSCVIFLEVKKEALIPPHLGQVLHAFFLDSVQNIDESYSLRLHNPLEIKPFTISPLQGKVEYAENRWRLFPGEKYYFRITSIEPELSHWLVEKWLKSLPEVISLAGTYFHILGWELDHQGHPWAGRSSYEDLYDKYISLNTSNNKVGIEFFSPTTFSSKGNNYPLPDPEKVFSNLLKKWNHYSPVHLGDDFMQFIQERVSPSRLQIQTRIIHFKNYKKIGFVGNCFYNVRYRGEEELILKILKMLGEYTFYAGVGYKTTMGMGQARPVIK